MSASDVGGAAVSEARPFVTVVVPVFDDPDGLRRCLRALDAQSYPASGYEVLVVDNGSRHSPTAIVQASQHARLIVESRPGSYSARNAGIGQAKGQILAFTDADCIPQPEWIERGVRALEEEPRRGLIAGRVRVPARRPDHPTAIELYTMVNIRRQHANVALDRFGETANVLTRRQVLEQVGLFDERLRSCGDLEWSRRVFAAGWTLYYAADATVDHLAVGSLWQLVRRYARLVGGKYDIRRYHGAAMAVTRTSPIDRGQLAVCLRRSWRDPRVSRLSDRLRVSAILLLLQVVAVVERCRLRLGGNSLR